LTGRHPISPVPPLRRPGFRLFCLSGFSSTDRIDARPTGPILENEPAPPWHVAVLAPTVTPQMGWTDVVIPWVLHRSSPRVRHFRPPLSQLRLLTERMKPVRRFHASSHTTSTGAIR
jgi:hypothetical protein